MTLLEPIAPPLVLPQRVLLVENSRTYVRAVAQAIEQELELPVETASTLAEARRLLGLHDDWFLALTGLVLADGQRDDVVSCLLERGLPTVVVTGVYDEDLRARLLRRRVIDFVLKDNPGSLDYNVWLVKRLERNRRISALVVDASARPAPTPPAAADLRVPRGPGRRRRGPRCASSSATRPSAWRWSTTPYPACTGSN